MPEIAPPAKIAKIKAYGAEAVIGGASYAEAQERCDAYVAESGALLIHPYDAVETIAGQGTVALEWEEDLERAGLEKLDTVLVAVGGGGLIAGVAAWFRGRVKVVGVEPEGSRALHAALEADRPVDVTVNSLAANSLGAKRVGELDFDIAKSFVSGVVLVKDAAHRRGAAPLWAESSIIAEPGGAAAFAALASGAYRPELRRAGRRSRLRRQRRSQDIRAARGRLRRGLERKIARSAIAARDTPNYCPPAFRQGRN